MGGVGLLHRRLSVCAARMFRTRGQLWACLAIRLGLLVIFLKFYKIRRMEVCSRRRGWHLCQCLRV